MEGRQQYPCFEWETPILSEIDPDRSSHSHLLAVMDEDSRCAAMENRRTNRRLRVLNDDENPNAYLLGECKENRLEAYEPKQKYSEVRFRDDWQDFTTGTEPRRYQVEGGILFAEDIPQLFQELHVLVEKRESDWAKQAT